MTSSNSQNPDRISQLATSIRRIQRRVQPDEEELKSNIVSHPALGAQAANGDPLAAIALLQGQQRDLHIDLQTTNRVTHRMYSDVLGRLVELEQLLPEIDSDLKRNHHNIHLLVSQIEQVLAENQGLRAEVDLLTQKQEITSEEVERTSATLKRLEQKRLTISQLIGITGASLVLVLLGVGQFRQAGLVKQLNTIQNDIQVLYGNDNILRNELYGR